MSQTFEVHFYKMGSTYLFIYLFIHSFIGTFLSNEKKFGLDSRTNLNNL